jgi:glycosyltransferase involved in cell wall biosynthesis
LLNDKLINISPSIVVFVRLVEKNSLKVLKWAKYYSVPTVHFIDDDLLRFPKSLGIEKYNYYTCSDRVKVFKRLLTETTLVYCSTKRLKESLEKNDIVATFEVAKIYCSGEVLCSPKTSEVITIGYMGTNHQNDFKLIIRPLVELLKRNKNVKFEIMGKTPMPKELLEFSSQIKVIPWVQSYSQFRETLVSLDWDIGLCPLEKNTFNLAKADTKWVEYSSCGIAVIASSGTVYDASADGNCALLADSSDEWLQALESLVFDSNTRKTLVRNAQKKLLNHYSITMLGEQLLHVFKKVQILNQRNVSEMIDG